MPRFASTGYTLCPPTTTYSGPFIEAKCPTKGQCAEAFTNPEAKVFREGSNAQKQEKETYHKFVTYVREVGGGRRSCGQKHIELGNILEFVTGASEEPVLGFCMAPSIHFILPFETEIPNSSEKD